MSRRIEGDELKNLDLAIETARAAATQSTCERDHRGAVVFKDGKILASASNGPIPPFECNPDKCGNVCGIYAMHAERLAIIKALESEEDLTDASILHVKVGKAGEIEVSQDLRCEDCTGYMVRVGRNKKGMRLAEFLLFQEDGWVAYEITEIDKITRKNLGINYEAVEEAR